MAKGCAQENSTGWDFHERWKILERAASYASSSGNQCASRNVSVDKFLGFCNLLCSNSWDGAFCQYYPFPGKNKENHGCNFCTNGRNLSACLSCDPAIYLTVWHYGGWNRNCQVPFLFLPAAGSLGTSGSSYHYICNFYSLGKAAGDGAQEPVPSYESYPHGRSFCHYYGTLRYWSGGNPGICLRAWYLWKWKCQGKHYVQAYLSGIYYVCTDYGIWNLQTSGC